MKYTPNYGLKKPEQDDFYNVEDFNENADIIDEKLKEIEDGIENIEVPVTSVNEKTGDVVLTAEDVGAETPAGAQAKAEAAAGAVQAELDAHVADNTAHGVNTRMPIAGGTFTGVVTAQSNTSYMTRQVRNIILSTVDPSGGSNGDIWIKYE